MSLFGRWPFQMKFHIVGTHACVVATMDRTLQQYIGILHSRQVLYQVKYIVFGWFRLRTRHIHRFRNLNWTTYGFDLRFNTRVRKFFWYLGFSSQDFGYLHGLVFLFHSIQFFPNFDFSPFWTNAWIKIIEQFTSSIVSDLLAYFFCSGFLLGRSLRSLCRGGLFFRHNLKFCSSNCIFFVKLIQLFSDFSLAGFWT